MAPPELPVFGYPVEKPIIPGQIAPQPPDSPRRRRSRWALERGDRHTIDLEEFCAGEMCSDRGTCQPHGAARPRTGPTPGAVDHCSVPSVFPDCMWDTEFRLIMGGDVLAGTVATVRSTDFVRALTGEIRHAVLQHYAVEQASTAKRTVDPAKMNRELDPRP